MATVILFMVRVGNKGNNDYSSVVQTVLQMQGAGGCAFSVSPLLGADPAPGEGRSRSSGLVGTGSCWGSSAP